MKTRTLFVAPAALNRLPRGDHPTIPFVRASGRVRRLEDFVGKRLAGETGRVSEHHAILDSESRQCLRSAVAQPKLHADLTWSRLDPSPERNAIRQRSLRFQ